MVYSFSEQLYKDCCAHVSAAVEVCQLGVGTEQDSAHQIVIQALGRTCCAGGVNSGKRGIVVWNLR